MGWMRRISPHVRIAEDRQNPLYGRYTAFLFEGKCAKTPNPYSSFFGSVTGSFEGIATSVRFEGVLATRCIIVRFALGIVRLAFGNFVVFHGFIWTTSPWPESGKPPAGPPLWS